MQNVSHHPGTVEVVLTASPRRLALAPGKVTEAYAYNGSVPGPTLEVHEGDRVIVHFRNDLPGADHHPLARAAHPGRHGRQPARARSRPARATTTSSRSSAARPAPTGIIPHPDLRSGYQIAKGLFGAIIVRAADDPLPHRCPSSC